MGRVWTEQHKFQKMLEVEKTVARVQGELNIIPKRAGLMIDRKARFYLKNIHQREKTTRHDVVAFIEEVASHVGSPYDRYVHYGLTSSDVLDTALSLQVRDADKVLKKAFKKLESAFLFQIRRHRETICAGRTHGMHAEPLSFGLKLSGFLAEFYRGLKRYHFSLKDMLIGKLSGPVGTYSLLSEKVEKRCCVSLKLKPEILATQVIPRDRHAALMVSLSFFGNFLERLSIELRHLQRTEVGEVAESFSKNQKGSSAMPHKKNPISAENITGVARLLRSYAFSAMENVALWHERDISHSSVERVIFPDAFILCDYALWRMAELLKNLSVDKKRMRENMGLSQGSLYTAALLTSLIRKGFSRQEAYHLLQSFSHHRNSVRSPTSPQKIQNSNLKNLKEQLLQDKKIQLSLTEKELEDIFSGKFHKKIINDLLKTRMKNNFLKKKILGQSEKKRL